MNTIAEIIDDISRSVKADQAMGYIQNNLSQAALYGQLAEECTELAKAALKMQRFINGDNPPRMTEKEITDNINEEMADVLVSLAALGFITNDAFDEALLEKPVRWAEHIKKEAEKRGKIH